MEPNVRGRIPWLRLGSSVALAYFLVFLIQFVLVFAYVTLDEMNESTLVLTAMFLAFVEAMFTTLLTVPQWCLHGFFTTLGIVALHRSTKRDVPRYVGVAIGGTMGLALALGTLSWLEQGLRLLHLDPKLITFVVGSALLGLRVAWWVDARIRPEAVPGRATS